ncbi:aftiphilin isoform X2 [Lethenteron reissneri]|uniref:aftiphilin isoform X2 n=1 Tax=Lethenteron reissneri TaxID=7753 RepID=UPI002AB70450|nr:aftiphilin isoform X2 [Lethenteron reissneri]
MTTLATLPTSRPWRHTKTPFLTWTPAGAARCFRSPSLRGAPRRATSRRTWRAGRRARAAAPCPTCGITTTVASAARCLERTMGRRRGRRTRRGRGWARPSRGSQRAPTAATAATPAWRRKAPAAAAALRRQRSEPTAGSRVASRDPGLVNGFDAGHPAKGTAPSEVHEQSSDIATTVARRRRSVEPSPASTPCASPCPSQDGFGDFEEPGAEPRPHPTSETTAASLDGVGAPEANGTWGLPDPAESPHPLGSGQFADFAAFASPSLSALPDGEEATPGDVTTESERTARSAVGSGAEADTRETVDSDEGEPHAATCSAEVDERLESRAGTTDTLLAVEDTEFADFSSAAFMGGDDVVAAAVDAERTCPSASDDASCSRDAAAIDKSHAPSHLEQPGADDSWTGICANEGAPTRTPPLTAPAEFPPSDNDADGAAHSADSEQTPAEPRSTQEPLTNLEDADDFGDFDVAATATAGATAASTAPTMLSEQPTGAGDEEEFADFSAPAPQQLSADDAEGEDDFGSFREASAAKSPASEDDFGDFGAAVVAVADGDAQGSLAASDSAEFGDFASEQAAGADGDLNDGDGFADFSRARSPLGKEGEAQQQDEEEGGWAAFGTAQSSDEFGAFGEAPGSSGGTRGVEFGQGGAARAGAATAAPADVSTLSLLQRVFQACFPCPSLAWAEDAVVPLREVMVSAPQGAEEEVARHRPALALWAELVETDDAHGLRYQWGGSHTNKRLLSALGIDTRNILFTGQKKQPVIVPVYAAGLGMLEPTKGPMNPISAAEKIASIAQGSGTATPGGAGAAASGESAQEGVAAAQFDWSGSGLKNPLDGVDPELFELTTAKMESASTVSRVTDAIARLMSTADKTLTSARRPRREEKLSGEALSVMAALPDLSFMRAKVLMFPSTLTPTAPACGAVGVDGP